MRPAQPAARFGFFRGVLRETADGLTLHSGGVVVEVLATDTLPASAGALRKARLATLRAFRAFVGQHVLVYGRQHEATILEAQIYQSTPEGEIPPTVTPKEFDRVRKVIEARGSELRKVANVIDVRPGYRFKDGWITGEPCIVVVVRQKLGLKQLPPGLKLPARLDGIGVDVTPATPVEQLLANQITAESATNGRPLVSAASRLDVPGSDWVSAEVLAPQAAVQAAPQAAKSPYIPPKGVQLNAITGPVTLLCHASPDDGWPNLQNFIRGVRNQLTVAMYDFTAPHILTAVGASIRSAGADLRLILDPRIALTAGGVGVNPKANDVTEDDVRKTLATQLGAKFDFEWAAVTFTGKTTSGIFPTAYHIKVAVRDTKSFWLSSGNWQSSNQPNLDPAAPHSPDGSIPGLQTTYDRDWHVIVDHPGLAVVYEKFIEWDMSQAQPFQVGASKRPRPGLLVPQPAVAEAAAAKFFQAQSMAFTRPSDITIQPLLTPDNYADFILKLIQSAKKSIYFQNQYINIPALKQSDKFAALWQALKSKLNAPGFDVRIILRDLPNTRPMLEALQKNGFDMKRVRAQLACHNKGIIIDHSVVVVGSHNWSTDGTTLNRDASLIITNAQVAQYFEQIFLYDWNNLARQKLTTQVAMPQIAVGDAPAPEGMVRVPWEAVFDDEDQADIDDALDSATSAAAIPATVTPVAQAAVAQAASGRRLHALVQKDEPILSNLAAAKRALSAQYLPKSKLGGQVSRAAHASTPMPEFNVIGVGIGEKFSDGKRTGSLAVKFLVQKKFAEAHIAPECLLPKGYEGLPTDVDEVGWIRPQGVLMPDPRAQWRPAQPGCSVGFRYPAKADTRMAGTFGAVVQDAQGNRYILSNNHVLADEGRIKPGAPIFQAGLLDLSQSQAPSQIATLTRFIPYDPDNPMKVDCAIAKALQPELLRKDVLEIGAPLGVTSASHDMIVHKYGRTTGYTVGRVTSVSTDVVVTFETGTYRFENQIIICGLDTSTPFSSGGDSGSLILERGPRMQAIGLLFSGSPTHSVANDINDVLQALDVMLA